jgi:signal transduction histidine kinase
MGVLGPRPTFPPQSPATPLSRGRIQESYEPVDLAALTADIASNFRSACERAGVTLELDCPPVGEPVYVDREMCEKIVLNLLSNAFKFLLRGRIDVAMRRDARNVWLAVTATGTGIPKAELSRIFERFHRIEGQRGRTHEGTGFNTIDPTRLFMLVTTSAADVAEADIQ